jgi:hypothetical protein
VSRSPESLLLQLGMPSIEGASPTFCGEGSFGSRLELRSVGGLVGHRPCIIAVSAAASTRRFLNQHRLREHGLGRPELK